MNKIYKAYAGIGSRLTPLSIRSRFAEFGKILAQDGWVLRSGGADGADSAFEQGALSVQGLMEIYLGWKNFNNHKSPLYNTKEEAFTIASDLHPAWHKCSWGAKKLLARNCHQILGQDLDSPVSFVIAWTDLGLLKGGTALALRLAMERSIPIYNFGDGDYTNKIISWANS